MKHIFTLALALLIISCASPGNFTLTEAQIRDTTTVAGTFDTLAAYRKAPGQPKTVQVRGYYRKDSTYVAGHKRSARTVTQ